MDTNPQTDPMDTFEEMLLTMVDSDHAAATGYAADLMFAILEGWRPDLGQFFAMVCAMHRGSAGSC